MRINRVMSQEWRMSTRATEGSRRSATLPVAAPYMTTSLPRPRECEAEGANESAVAERLCVALHHFPVILEDIQPRGFHRHIRHVPVTLRSNETLEGFRGCNDRHGYPRTHVQDVATIGRHPHARLDRRAVQVWFPLLGTG